MNEDKSALLVIACYADKKTNVCSSFFSAAEDLVTKKPIIEEFNI